MTESTPTRTQRTRIPRLCSPALALALAAASAGCEDPARPLAPPDGSFLSVDSEPRGGAITIDGVATGERTPATFASVRSGLRRVDIALDTLGLTYTYSTFVVVDTASEASVMGRLTIRCATRQCVREAAQFHSAGELRFAVNAAGPLFFYDGVDAGIVWPASTPNSYASIGVSTLAGTVQGQGLALGLGNVGNGINYWAGLPAPRTETGPIHRAGVSAWVIPMITAPLTIRGLEIAQEVVVDAGVPDVLVIDVSYRNISADSAYLAMDPSAPPEGVTYADVYLGFILDPDIGSAQESDDDLVSYSPERGLVFAYDGDFAVTGFTGGWSARPGLVGLMVVDGPGPATRLNAWPDSLDFLAGVNEARGYAFLTAGQLTMPDHPDPRVGYAPDATRADYRISAANGPISLAPGEQQKARFAVLLAAPVAGTFESGVVQPAGDPADTSRAIAVTAGGLFELADAIAQRPAPAAGD